MVGLQNAGVSVQKVWNAGCRREPVRSKQNTQWEEIYRMVSEAINVWRSMWSGGRSGRFLLRSSSSLDLCVSMRWDEVSQKGNVQRISIKVKVMGTSVDLLGNDCVCLVERQRGSEKKLFLVDGVKQAVKRQLVGRKWSKVEELEMTAAMIEGRRYQDVEPARYRFGQGLWRRMMIPAKV